jgi:hypothetical protein
LSVPFDLRTPGYSNDINIALTKRDLNHVLLNADKPATVTEKDVTVTMGTYTHQISVYEALEDPMPIPMNQYRCWRQYRIL